MNSLLSVVNGCNESTIKPYRETYIKYKYTYKLEVLADGNEFFSTYILESSELPSGLISTPFQKRLYAAKKFNKLSTGMADCVKTQKHQL